ncbi:transglutaminase family protein [Rhodobacterales bacterium LSUCC0246]|nr:transglutaminase family protein [Rhodobacterales bacterium LSUCC0374]
MRQLTVSIHDCNGEALLAPTGIMTRYQDITSFGVQGGRITSLLHETDLGLSAAMILPDRDTVTLSYAIDEARVGRAYPTVAFEPRDSRYTIASEELQCASQEIAQAAGGGAAGIAALVAATEARFAYDHPIEKFNDGMERVPYLSCGLTPGSCVDINTYLVASLRGAGYEAAYVYGYFFPEARGGFTDDGHCWVVTRHAGTVLEWDIAHHMKAGLGPTKPGLNPRPGARVAVTHSMGQRYCGKGLDLEVKVLGEPMRLNAPNSLDYVRLEARVS